MSFSASGWVRGLALNKRQRAVLNVLADRHNDETGLCFPSMSTIAAEAGYCERSVRTSLCELERARLITITSEVVPGSSGRPTRRRRAFILHIGSTPEQPFKAASVPRRASKFRPAPESCDGPAPIDLVAILARLEAVEQAVAALPATLLAALAAGGAAAAADSSALAGAAAVEPANVPTEAAPAELAPDPTEILAPAAPPKVAAEASGSAVASPPDCPATAAETGKPCQNFRQTLPEKPEGFAAAYIDEQEVEPERNKGGARKRAARPPAARRTRLPHDWMPNPADRAYAEARGLDPNAVGQKFARWARARGAAMADWSERFRLWCDEDADAFHGRGRGQPPAQQSKMSWMLEPDYGPCLDGIWSEGSR